MPRTSGILCLIRFSGEPAGGPQLPVRGRVDNNVMYQDLSVETYNAIQNNGVPIGEHDERFDAVPYWRSGGSYPSLRVFVPRS